MDKQQTNSGGWDSVFGSSTPTQSTGWNKVFSPNTSSNSQSISQSSTNPKIPTATNAAIQSGADPQDLANAKAQLGDQNYIGLCEKFVENNQGKDDIYPTAGDAWNAQLAKAKTGFDGVKPGDQVFFTPDASNNYDGHTGIYAGNNRFVSATDNGIQVADLNGWQQLTGQKLLGYVPYSGGNQ